MKWRNNALARNGPWLELVVYMLNCKLMKYDLIIHGFVLIFFLFRFQNVGITLSILLQYFDKIDSSIFAGIY